MPKNKTQNKTKSKNRKQTPNNNKTHKAQNRHCEQGQLSRRKVMAYASQQSHQYGFPRLQSVHHHIVKASFSSCSNFGERPYACSDNSLRARDPNIKALFFPSVPAFNVDSKTSFKSWMRCSVLTRTGEVKFHSQSFAHWANIVLFFPSVANCQPVNVNTSSMAFFDDSTLPGKEAKI